MRDICFVSAIPLSLEAFIAPHARAAARSHRVTLVASSAPRIPDLDPAVRFSRIEIPRRISPAADLRALLALWRFFRARRFDAVISITPKAGMLTMLAGRLARVPVRIHWFTGQVWATRTGAGRALLKSVDRLLARSGTNLLADSASQREFLVREGIVEPDQVTVLASGSVAGVDTARFKPDPSARAAVRERLGIPSDAVVALYLGRLSVDKGMRELAAAFASAARGVANLHLLIVGPDEDAMRPDLEAALGDVLPRVHFATVTPEPEAYMAAADVFVLPSYREGFGVTVIEAAACGLPSIASRIYGLTDAVADGETGVLVPVRDAHALASAIGALARDAARRTAMGQKARARVERDFAQPVVTAAFSAFVAAALEARARG